MEATATAGDAGASVAGSFQIFGETHPDCVKNPEPAGPNGSGSCPGIDSTLVVEIPFSSLPR